MIAWHYTTGKKFDLILSSGVLLPADIGVVEPELPILWFSTHPRYEPSALKAIAYSDGTHSTATLEELYELAGGLARFGCSISRLKCGENLRKAAKMQSLVWRRLVKRGAQMKANPSDWWGHVGTMPLDEITIEIMNTHMQWCRVPKEYYTAV
jgi:hypothetical protein